MIVRWLSEARADLIRISRHIAQENPRAASKMARELLLAADSLVLFPNRGRHGLAAGTREILAVWPYLLVYEVDDIAGTIDILRVWHGARDR